MPSPVVNKDCCRGFSIERLSVAEGCPGPVDLSFLQVFLNAMPMDAAQTATSETRSLGFLTRIARVNVSEDRAPCSDVINGIIP